MKELIAAVIKAQQEFPDIIKDSKNPHFGNTYASLGALLDAITPTLNANRLMIQQQFEAEGSNNYLTTHLYHTSGEFLYSRQLLVPQRNDPQGIASASTYARRYGILAMLSLAAADDDGNAASTPQTDYNTHKTVDKGEVKAEPKKPGVKEATNIIMGKKITLIQGAKIEGLVAKRSNPAKSKDAIMTKYKVLAFEELTKGQADEIISQLEKPEGK